MSCEKVLHLSHIKLEISRNKLDILGQSVRVLGKTGLWRAK
jgi:hypothetical protein